MQGTNLHFFFVLLPFVHVLLAAGQPAVATRLVA